MDSVIFRLAARAVLLALSAVPILPAEDVTPEPARPLPEASNAGVAPLSALAAFPLETHREKITSTGKFTAGVASDFQLTLGGEFSGGLAQQNGFTVDVRNLFRDRSTLRLGAWNTLDTADGGNDWISSVNYILPLKAWEAGELSLNLGAHRWQFPSVLTGGSDYIADSGLIWNQHAGPFGFTLDANVKTLVRSATRKGTGGQIYYFRGVTAHPLHRAGSMSLALIHGPSFTYANRFYGCRGARVLRYEAGVSLKHRGLTAEVLFRPQLALQDRIPEHMFWSAGISFVLW